MFRIHATAGGLLIEEAGRFLAPRALTLDAIFSAGDPAGAVRAALAAARPAAAPDRLLAPIQSQEVWAAGVTYLRSKSARMAESKDAGGGTFYDRVYEADRPELFFKSSPGRVIGPGGAVRIRADSRWNVPEPELTLALDAAGRIFGYTIGNDMSSRDIEGENLLYLPQAKIYRDSCALGPCIALASEAEARQWQIAIQITRRGERAFAGATQVAQIKRSFGELAEYLFRSQEFPHGAVLLTGTGIVPPESFSLQTGDEIAITIDGIGTLPNSVHVV